MDGWTDRQVDKTIRTNVKQMLTCGTVRGCEAGNLIAVNWVVRENYAFLAKYETGESQVRV